MYSKVKWAMNQTTLVRVVLGVSGVLAAGIASTILFAPEAFYGSYGIDVADNTTLVNELKAPAGMLLIAGLVMFAGVFRQQLMPMSLVTATVVYLSYGLSRILSIVLDGMPDSGMVSAASIEILIGVVCLLTFQQVRKPPRSQAI